MYVSVLYMRSFVANLPLTKVFDLQVLTCLASPGKRLLGQSKYILGHVVLSPRVNI